MAQRCIIVPKISVFLQNFYYRVIQQVLLNSLIVVNSYLLPHKMVILVSSFCHFILFSAPQSSDYYTYERAQRELCQGGRAQLPHTIVAKISPNIPADNHVIILLHHRINCVCDNIVHCHWVGRWRDYQEQLQKSPLSSGVSLAALAHMYSEK